MSRKVILCRCEDVTLADVQHAVGIGYADLEEVKRYTGFGTGPCQGKDCLRAVALAIAAAARRPAAAIHPFTTRPPLVPTELKYFARRDPSTSRPSPRPLAPGDDDP